MFHTAIGFEQGHVQQSSTDMTCQARLKVSLLFFNFFYFFMMLIPACDYPLTQLIKGCVLTLSADTESPTKSYASV